MQSLAEISQSLGVEYLFHLSFHTCGILRDVKKRSSKAIRKKELSRKEQWAGVHYHKEIVHGYTPQVCIRWIDENIGYGVFALQPIRSGAFIGEYTGEVRKRRPFVDRKNDYTFEYTIGDWPRNPYIIDAKRRGNFTRFINHCDQPNLDSLSVYVGEVMHIIFLSKEEIAPGEQLCYHYGDTFWSKRPSLKRVSPNSFHRP